MPFYGFYNSKSHVMKSKSDRITACGVRFPSGIGGEAVHEYFLLNCKKCIAINKQPTVGIRNIFYQLQTLELNMDEYNSIVKFASSRVRR